MTENMELEIEDENEFLSGIINEISYVKGEMMIPFPTIIVITVQTNCLLRFMKGMRKGCGKRIS